MDQKQKNIEQWKLRQTDAWFDEVQAEKRRYHTSLLVEKAKFDAASPEEQAAVLKAQDEAREAIEREREAWHDPDYDYHPRVNEKNEWQVVNVLSPLTGLSKRAVQNHVRSLCHREGLDFHDAYQKMWKELRVRTDKKFVSLDLETNSPFFDGRMDNGPYSTIIEAGYLTYDPTTQETRDEKSVLYGIPEALSMTTGTGQEDVHGISPEMVQGLPVLTEDEKSQQDLMADLDNSVIVAHNAFFEKNQLGHNLRGFNKAVAENRIEILDTRAVSMFFVPSAPTNTNEDFVTATGGTYEDAHRALPDARMTLMALLRALNNR